MISETRIPRSLSLPLLGVSLAALSACTVVDRGALNRVEERQGSDMGVVVGSDTCNPNTPVIAAVGGTERFVIDTTGRTNSVSTNNCRGGGITPGNDTFLAIDVAEGEYWHFHLQRDSSFTDNTDRNPVVYALPAQGDGCNTQFCDQFADRCSTGSDEHFAFVATSTGRWYIGVDDQNPGGGHYILDAIRPVCGDGMSEHGEACDDGNASNGDDCDNLCRKVLRGGSELIQEGIPNDNETEANVLDFDVTGVLRVRGTVGGPIDCYPDVYAITVPQDGRIRVQQIQSFSGQTETECSPGTDSPFTITRASRAGGNTQPGGEDANGCILLESANLDAGEYLITIDTDVALDAAQAYTMRFELLPPL